MCLSRFEPSTTPVELFSLFLTTPLAHPLAIDPKVNQTAQTQRTHEEVGLSQDWVPEKCAIVVWFPFKLAPNKVASSTQSVKSTNQQTNKPASQQASEQASMQADTGKHKARKRASAHRRTQAKTARPKSMQAHEIAQKMNKATQVY